MEPLVSVIVPVYNSERYLDRCISSILNQTLKEIELILISDASPDNSKEIMERYKKEDDRVVTLYNKVNGYPNPRKVGILAAKANYIGFVDADDWVEPTFFEKLYVATNDEKIDVAIADLQEVDDDGNILRKKVIFPKSLFKENVASNVKDELLRLGGVGYMFTNIWRKSIIIDNDLHFLDHNVYCDEIVKLWYLKANSFAKVNECLYDYYVNVKSLSRKKDNFRFYERLISSVDVMERAKKMGIYSSYREGLDYYFYCFYLRNSVCVSAMKFTKPQYKWINRIKNDYKKLTKDINIKQNPYYIKAKKNWFDYSFAIINTNIYLGGWFVHKIYALKEKVKRFR